MFSNPRRSRIFALLLLVISVPAAAHFLLNLNVRIFHVDHRADGLMLYARMPMPYLVADKLGEIPENGMPDPAPFTTNAMEDDLLVHFVAWDQLREASSGLGQIFADSLQVEAADGLLTPEVVDTRVHVLGEEAGFATLAEAVAIFDSEPAWPPDGTRVYVGDAVVDVQLYLPGRFIDSRIQLIQLAGSWPAWSGRHG